MLAAEQYGVVSAADLRGVGLNGTAIKVRARNGRLHRVHRGVYAVGHPALTLRGRFMAGVLACAPSGHLGYRAGSAHWEFMDWDDAYLIELTTPYSAPRSHRGLRIHRTRLLDPRDFTKHQGILVTTVARTLLDLAEVLPDKGLRRAVRQAQALNLTNQRLIADILTRAGGRRGAEQLAALIADGPAPTRSELEDLVLDVIDGGGLARPRSTAASAASTPTCAGPSSSSPSNATAPPGTRASSLPRTTRSARPDWRPTGSACCGSRGSRRSTTPSRRSRG